MGVLKFHLKDFHKLSIFQEDISVTIFMAHMWIKQTYEILHDMSFHVKYQDLKGRCDFLNFHSAKARIM